MAVTELLAMPAAAGQPQAAPARSHFRPDIEGLRAVAVFFVVAYHASLPFVPGGFVGVDVFFVISGFLITGLLLREFARSGRIDFAMFYARRARRILPAAALVITATAVAGWFIYSPLGMIEVSKDLVSGSLYFANWHFIQTGTDYLAQTTNVSPALHLWSLAVEEQFYLVWPLLILVVAALAAKFGRARFAIVAAVLAALTAASFALSVSQTATDPKVAYMATTTRAWEFGVGALVAVLAFALGRRVVRDPAAGGSAAVGSAALGSAAVGSAAGGSAAVGSAARGSAAAVVGWVLGWAGVVALVWAVLTFSDATPFPGSAAALPALGACAVILGGLLAPHSRTSDAALLSLRPVRYVGRLSYAWYLWHWPVLILAEAKFGPLPVAARCALMVGALVLAGLTFHLLEAPLSKWRLLQSRARAGLVLGLVAVLVSTGAAFGAGALAQAKVSAVAAAPDAPAAVAPVAGAAPAPSALQLLTARLTATGDGTGGAVTPALLDAAKDTSWFPAECFVGTADITSPNCELDSSSVNSGVVRAGRVVLLGDSHAMQWYPVARALADAKQTDVDILGKAGCPLATMTVVNPKVGAPYEQCDTWRAAMLDRLASGPKPSVVIISELNRYGAPDVMGPAWQATMAKLGALGVPVIYLVDNPYPMVNAPECVSGHTDQWSGCRTTRENAFRPDVLQQAIAAGSYPNAYAVSANEYLCPTADATCPMVRNGLLLYRDESHLTNTAARALAPLVLDEIDALGLPQ